MKNENFPMNHLPTTFQGLIQYKSSVTQEQSREKTTVLNPLLPIRLAKLTRQELNHKWPDQVCKIGLVATTRFWRSKPMVAEGKKVPL